jgi:hypothetical protein
LGNYPLTPLEHAPEVALVVTKVCLYQTLQVLMLVRPLGLGGGLTVGAATRKHAGPQTLYKCSVSLLL